ncbi:hypothetical protein [Rhizosaccharibacter radicis]|uniref:Uncharacterized protein n=1 Tax=Rhizosaccharibacter radicis TaxID=2782605 RepID=A0ABT1VXP1_9PROT|nr:hypothetical protein [Acetobacteraceae bacterium KSS12]
MEIPPQGPRPPRRSGIEVALRVAGMGLLTGLGFVLPVIALLAEPAAGVRQNLLIGAAGVFAVLLVRSCGRVFLRATEAAERPARLPLIGLYGLLALSPLAAILRFHPNF